MAQITLNKNSWHFKYYSSLVSDTAPKSLCPYFWTMVFLIMISPITAISWLFIKTLSITTEFFHRIVPKRKKSEPKYRTTEEIIKEYERLEEIRLRRVMRYDKAGNVIRKIFKFVIIPVGIVYIIYFLHSFVTEHGWKMFLTYMVIAFLSAALFGLWMWLLEKYAFRTASFIIKVLNRINPLRWKVVIVVGEMIKAAYTNMCPLINWRSEE